MTIRIYYLHNIFHLINFISFDINLFDLILIKHIRVGKIQGIFKGLTYGL